MYKINNHEPMLMETDKWGKGQVFLRGDSDEQADVERSRR